MTQEEKKLIKIGLDPWHLQRWRATSTKAKLQWLQDALDFANTPQRTETRRHQ